MKHGIVGLLGAVFIACAIASSGIAAPAEPAPKRCNDDSECPGERCMDYDCDGIGHCTQPGQGGNGNCCVFAEDCIDGFHCDEDGHCTPSDCDPDDCVGACFYEHADGTLWPGTCGESDEMCSCQPWI